jgi:Flp pilus assembly protein TadD
VLEAITGHYQRAARLPEAIALFTAALATRPRDERLLSALAVALDKGGEWQRAIEAMRGVLELSPGNANAANFVGYLLADHGQDLGEAQRLVQRALDQRPDSPAFLDSMGWVFFRKGELERAGEYLARAAEAAPDEATISEHLGDAEAALGRRARAAEAWARALELVAADPEAADRPGQRAELERKLKLLTSGAPTR